MRRLLATLLLCAVAAIAVACGGGEDEQPGPDQAEQTVREYLTALVDKKGADACAKLTPEYQESVIKQNESFAKSQNADTCAELIDAITRSAPSVAFEGDILRRENIAKLDLKTTVRESGDQQNATVTGARGIQRYELETRDGKWLIAKIERDDSAADNPPAGGD